MCHFNKKQLQYSWYSYDMYETLSDISDSSGPQTYSAVFVLYFSDDMGITHVIQKLSLAITMEELET